MIDPTIKKAAVLSVVLTFVLSVVFAQNKPFDFDKAWRHADSLITVKGLPKSAMQEVSAIYAAAKKENNNAQVIRALIYRVSLIQQTEDKNFPEEIADLESEMKTSTGAKKAILQSILAGAYLDYYQNHRYQYSRRTTVSDSTNPFSTWSSEDFDKKISGLFLASVAEQAQLQRIDLPAYRPIILFGNAGILRPTLFDLLVHRAIDFFESGNIFNAQDPGIRDPDLFAPAAQFIAWNPGSSGTGYAAQAMRLHRQALAFHSQDKNPAAFIDEDIHRLIAARNFSTLENKDSLYISALEKISAAYPDNPYAARAASLRAQEFVTRGNAYTPFEDSLYRYDLVQAAGICQPVMAQPDSSEGKSQCTLILQDILRRSVIIQSEQVNLPGEPFRILCQYKNITRVFFRVIPWPANPGNNGDEIDNWNIDWGKAVQASPIKKYIQDLPDTRDHQTHSCELKVDGLPLGNYALLASADSSFSKSGSVLCLTPFAVSRIAYAHSSEDFFVLNRQTGQPVAGAQVQFWNLQYNNSLHRNQYKKVSHFVSDQNGYFRATSKKEERYYNVAVQIISGQDELFIANSRLPYYLHSNEDSGEPDEKPDAAKFESDNQTTSFYTDRAIYRPGQLIYFKGILWTKDFKTQKPKILAGRKTRIVLRDPNSLIVDSVWLSTNSFGSFHGRFKAPLTSLTGQYVLEDSTTDSQLEIQVEEYKRPTFSVSFDSLKQAVRLDDSVTIHGQVMAFAGYALPGSRVHYTVSCMPQPIIRSFGWTAIAPLGDQQITDGETLVDDSGHFSIIFHARPLKRSPGQTQAYWFTINADVTDLNGESQSGETRIQIGPRSMIMHLGFPEFTTLITDSLKFIPLTTVNSNGHFQAAPVLVSIQHLVPPSRAIRKRFWARPDQFVISKEKFIESFPHDEYDRELDWRSWTVDQVTANFSDSTRADARIPVPKKGFQPGAYKIVVSTIDRYGQLLQDSTCVLLADPSTLSVPVPRYLTEWNAPERAGVGQDIRLGFETAAPELFVIKQITRDKKTFDFLQVKGHLLKETHRVEENDRGNFSIDYFFIYNNRPYTLQNNVLVPWDNKTLSVEYASFRNKTEPGSPEKWTIRVGGFHQPKETAEVLTSMYDQSLDQFVPQDWSIARFFPMHELSDPLKASDNFGVSRNWSYHPETPSPNLFTIEYDRLLDLPGRVSRRYLVKAAGVSVMREEEDKIAFAKKDITAKEASDSAAPAPVNNYPAGQGSPIAVRKALQETAFFFPNLYTSDSGTVEFSFTMPESLTQWKWMTLAHTKDLSIGTATTSIITQKQLMVQPNPPRFLRQGDHLELAVRIVNLSDSELTGQSQLQLFDPTTNEPVDGWFSNRQANQYFTVGAGQTTVVRFPVDVPYLYNKPLTYRFTAAAPGYVNGQSAQLSDGEEGSLPVLTNRILVTESLPISASPGQTNHYRFDKLLKSGEDESMDPFGLTVEFTANPVWYAVQAMPYLIQFPYECAEQTFNRFYANLLSSKILNSSPGIRKALVRWQSGDSSLPLSSLQKNEELKSALLQETPWVLEAKTEKEQMQRLGLLLDERGLKDQLQSALSKLAGMQSDGGGFPWFKGGRDDRYITQYILSGIGHLKKLGLLTPAFSQQLDPLIRRALAFLDRETLRDYEEILKKKTITRYIEPGASYYLYMRSFFPDHPADAKTSKAIDYFTKKAKQQWVSQGKYEQAMIALFLYRHGDAATTAAIIKSLTETAIQNKDLGMYWKEWSGGYYWYQCPVESQALLIEAFAETGQHATEVQAMKTWLLKQKQTQHWSTTKATAEACYALLMQGGDWTTGTPTVDIRLGDRQFSTAGDTTGYGYLKARIEPAFIKPELGNITVTMSGQPGAAKAPGWGAVYWQYFANIDQVTAETPGSNPLVIHKKLFVKRSGEKGPVLEPLAENGFVKIGDRVTVRIELKTDRLLEYVHLKDMRASCLEPVSVLSEWVWQNGLGYYQSTRDASTNFFFDHLPKGSWVFEYDLKVTQAGTFSNGICTAQCMYAPEFASHSEGFKLNAEEMP